MLVSKLFDVCSRSTLAEMEKKEEIRISWGMGIVGFVAESGEPVNIPDAYKVWNALKRVKNINNFQRIKLNNYLFGRMRDSIERLMPVPATQPELCYVCQLKIQMEMS